MLKQGMQFFIEFLLGKNLMHTFNVKQFKFLMKNLKIDELRQVQ